MVRLSPSPLGSRSSALPPDPPRAAPRAISCARGRTTHSPSTRTLCCRARRARPPAFPLVCGYVREEGSCADARCTFHHLSCASTQAVPFLREYVRIEEPARPSLQPAPPCCACTPQFVCLKELLRCWAEAHPLSRLRNPNWASSADINTEGEQRCLGSSRALMELRPICSHPLRGSECACSWACIV